MSDTVTVIQADREAAAEHILEMGAPLLGLPDAIAKGEVDSHPIVQLLARHRIAHEPKWLPIDENADPEGCDIWCGGRRWADCELVETGWVSGGGQTIPTDKYPVYYQPLPTPPEQTP